MKSVRQNGNNPVRQQGLVLFIALIALLVISLAAVALIRSVDTTTLISGNLMLKKTATNAGELILNDVMAQDGVFYWLGERIEDPATLDGDVAGAPFYKPMTTFDINPGDPDNRLTSDTIWTDANSREALLSCKGVVGATDCSANSIRYVIERMCKEKDLLVNKKDPRDYCLFGPASESQSERGITNPGDTKPIPTGDSLLYRVTARVEGPKGTVSYVQTFIY